MRRPLVSWQEIDADAFWALVDASDAGGCWPWLGPVSDGRGRHKGGYAYRWSWQLENQQAVPAGLFICHHCDNPICVRPDHLYAGTQKDNMQDAVQRGRHRPSGVFGLRTGAATVHPRDIQAAVSEYLRGGVTQAAMAARLGVAQATFGRWVRAEARPDTGLEGVSVGPGSRISTGLKPCGTNAAWHRHHARGEKPCAPCVEAHRIYMASYKAKRALARLGTQTSGHTSPAAGETPEAAARKGSQPAVSGTHLGT